MVDLGILMQQARCPYCQQKLQLPDVIPSGQMLQCAGCNNQFLPPTSSSPTDSAPARKKKKGRKSKDSGSWSTRSIVLVTSLVIIGLLLGTLLTMWLMQPGYGKFNEQLLTQYNKFSEIVCGQVSARPINHLPTFLKQFQQIGAQLQSLQDEIKTIQAPENEKSLLVTLSTLIDSMKFFSQTEVPQYLAEFKKKPDDEATVGEMYRSLIKMSTLHESLVNGQNYMAKKHGLTFITPRVDIPFFLTPRKP